MSIFQTLFGGGTSQVPVQPAPGNTNTNVAAPGTQGGTSGTAPNGVVPNQSTDPNTGGGTGESNASPLAAFQDVWKTVNDPNAANPQGLFSGLDPAKVMESASKVDFTKSISPEMLTAINGGGEGAMQAMLQAMNKVGQTAYAQSAIATTKIVEQALTRAQSEYDTKLPTLVRKLSANENILADNPLLANPAIQPLVGALQEQLVRKNPDATAAEIQAQVQDYFKALGTSFAPKTPETKEQKAAKSSMDWSTFLE